MELIGYLAALGAATCWAFGSLLSVGPVRLLGPIPFNALRMLMVASALTLALAVMGRLVVPNLQTGLTLALSGFVGIFLGDTLLFATVKILGPRLSGLLFACNAPMSFAIGAAFLGESYNWLNLLGVLGVMTGVFLAISSRGKAGSHAWEQAEGKVSLGLLFGLGAALCQSLGTVIVYDLMKSGQDPIFASMFRVWIAVICLFFSLSITRYFGGFAVFKRLTPRLVLQILVSGLVGMAIGMSLLLWAVNLAPLGIVSILSATTPVIVLPLLWIMTRQRPALPSFIAATVVVAGTALIFVSA